jgi:Leucine-rich repeat (LRR) protein
MKNLKLFFMVFLVKLAWSYGEDCMVVKDRKTLKLKDCKPNVLSSGSVNPDDVYEINGNAGNSFQKLNDGILKNYTNLESLVLKSCKTAEISAGAFQGLTKLKSLDLSNNHIINSLDENVFKS